MGENIIMENNDIIASRISNYTKSIKKSLESENWYAALALALTLPDVCSKLEFPTRIPSARYIDWFNEYLSGKYTVNPRLQTDNKTVIVSGRDAYAFRCAFLHEGESNLSNHPKRENLTDFVFVVPGEEYVIQDNTNNTNLPPERRLKRVSNLHKKLYSINDKEYSKSFVVLRVDEYCLDLCIAGEEWAQRVKDNREVQKRASTMLTIQEKSFKIGSWRITDEEI